MLRLETIWNECIEWKWWKGLVLWVKTWIDIALMTIELQRKVYFVLTTIITITFLVEVRSLCLKRLNSTRPPQL